MLVLLAIPVIVAVAFVHRFMQVVAPSNLLVRSVRSAPPRWRVAAALLGLAAVLSPDHARRCQRSLGRRAGVAQLGRARPRMGRAQGRMARRGCPPSGHRARCATVRGPRVAGPAADFVGSAPV